MPEITVIVPTLNEAGNLPALAERIGAALAGRSFEILIVDDHSADGTPEVCAELARTHPLKLIVRDDLTGGLSGAVLAGMAAAGGECLVVIDADLQHPPEKIPELLALLESGAADFVIGSRYVAGGATIQQWGWFRRLNSRLATLLARPFAGTVADPMSGFFALRRSTYLAGEHLAPLGYKIGLELMAKCRVRRVAEVPIEFGLRERGQSKLTIKEQFRYLEHLSRLYDFCYPRSSAVGKFGVVLVLGWIAGSAAAWVLSRAGWTPAAAVIGGYGAVIAVTALFHARYVRTQRAFLPRKTPWRDFAWISTGEWAACAAAAMYATGRLIVPGFVETTLLAFAAAAVTRYVLRKELLQDIRGLRKDVDRR